MDTLMTSDGGSLILVSIILGAVAICVSSVLLFRFKKLAGPLNAMTKLHEDLGTGGNLAQLLDAVGRNSQSIETQKEQISSIFQKLGNCYSGMGIVKYNAFEDIGGNQSYSICLLSSNRDGFIISNLVARNSARGYSIEVKSGAPSRELSNEEGEALQQAISSLNDEV